MFSSFLNKKGNHFIQVWMRLERAFVPLIILLGDTLNRIISPNKRKNGREGGGASSCQSVRLWKGCSDKDSLRMALSGCTWTTQASEWHAKSYATKGIFELGEDQKQGKEFKKLSKTLSSTSVQTGPWAQDLPDVITMPMSLFIWSTLSLPWASL